MSKKSMLEKLGLTEDVLKPKANDEKEQEQRIKDIEDALVELAEMLTEVENNG